MNKENIEHVDLAVPDIVGERVEILKSLFPDVVSEGKIDPEKLLSALGEEVDGRSERYSFTWAGKRDSIRLLQTPTRATLVPDEGESVNFEDTGNIFIEGDNLEVLKLLYKPYFGRVKMIYIDPPYNTGNDFVYPDDYSDPLDTYLRLTGQKDDDGNLLTSNADTSGRFHSAWLSMMYPRLFLARQLLRDDGIIFVSIDDNEVYNLRLLMNEVFGEENFVTQITILNNPKGRVLSEHFAACHDYLLAYARSSCDADFSVPKSEEEVQAQYQKMDEIGRYRELELRNTHRQFNRHTRPRLYFPLYVNPKDGSVAPTPVKGGELVLPDWDDGLEGCWSWGVEKVKREANVLFARKVQGRWKVFRKAYAYSDDGDVARRKLRTIWTERAYHTEVGQGDFDALIPGRVFQSPKPVGLLKTLLAFMAEEDIVVDFFAGSSTTAHAVLEQNREDGGNRRFIMVQLPQPTQDPTLPTIAEIGKERIRRVINKLQDAKQGSLDLPNGDKPEDLGFRVFKLAESNIKPWAGVTDLDAEAYIKQMELYIDPLESGWKSENVAWEIAVKEGYGLNSHIEKVAAITSNTIYRITDTDKEQSFHLCLDDGIDFDAVKSLGLTRDDLFVCRDVALTDDLAANLALQCRLKTV